MDFSNPLSTRVVGNMFGGLATKIMLAKLGQTLVSQRQTHWFFVAHHFACEKLCCAK
jgi:F0F1-type ATP synthase membrane subunit a